MADEFKFDVFLSHSTKDKVVVRRIAERLRENGLRFCPNEWEITHSDDIRHEIEDGLEHFRMHALCTSGNVSGREWTQLKSDRLRLHDPLSQDHRFILVRLDNAPSGITVDNKPAIDATTTLPCEGFKCPWTPLIRMDGQGKPRWRGSSTQTGAKEVRNDRT